MIWAEVTTANVLSHMPTDVLTRYNAWLVSYPDRADRLATITANTVREFRDAIKSNPANVVYDDENYLPQSCIRHCENIIIFTLGMEMGLTLDTAGASARVSADVFLRQIPYGRWNTTTNDDADVPTPRYKVPTASGGRVLTMLVALLLGATTARGGWIKDTATDQQIPVSYVPSHYSITDSFLWGHLAGLDSEMGNKMPYSKTNYYLGNSSIVTWNFANTNGVDLLGFRFVPNINYDNASRIDVTNLFPGLKFNFPAGTLTEDQMSLLKANTIAVKAIHFMNFSSTIKWNHNLEYEDGMLKFVDTNSYMIVTNTTSNSIMSLIGFASTNSSGHIDGSLNILVNDTNVLTITPISDGIFTKYDLPTYVQPWGVLKITWSPGIAIPGRDYYPPWFLNSTPSEKTSVATYGLANTNYYGTEVDFHSRPVFVDAPTMPRGAVPYKVFQDGLASTLAAANTETHDRTADTDLNGYDLRLNPRFVTTTYSNSFAHVYAGGNVFEIDGAGSMVIPEIIGFTVEAGAVATMTVYSYSGGATNLLPEVSTNLIDWTRLTNAIVSATNLDDYTAQVVFTNSDAVAQFVRLVDVSGGEGSPVTRITGSLEVNGIDISTGAGISASTATNIAQTVLAAATTNSMTNINWGALGGTGTVSGASATSEGDALVYAWATNIVLVAGTNLYAQRIAAISGPTTITAPTIGNTNYAARIWLTVPARGTNTVTILTNSPPVIGYVPTIPTNSVRELEWRWVPASSGWRVRATR